MAGTYLPLAAFLLATSITLLLATSSAVPVAAAAADKYTGGRMVIIRAPGATVVSAGGGAVLNNWQQQRRRRRLVEDEVAPEFSGLLGAGNDGGHVSDGALDKSKQVCLKTTCAEPGEPYIGRSCESKYGCPKQPTALHV